MYVCTYVGMSVCLYLSIYVSMYLCIYVSMYVYLCMCIYVYVCAYGLKTEPAFCIFYVIHGVNGVGWGGIITFIGTSSHICCYVIVWGGVGGIITFIGTSSHI